MSDFCRPYRCQLVKACEELVEGHDQLLRRALGRQAGETLDVGEQDAAGGQKDAKRQLEISLFQGRSLPSTRPQSESADPIRCCRLASEE